MSGHSKFANIKHKKEKNDAKKGKVFTIIGREIVMAVKAGGPDPNNNSKLRDVIAKAKANNMPNDTIDRGIKKAAGADSADNYEKAVYEGYGPNGVAIIVETLTDNKNRTASNVRNAFSKGNGSIGTQGCVSFMFDQKGQIIIDKEECEMDADEIATSLGFTGPGLRLIDGGKKSFRSVAIVSGAGSSDVEDAIKAGVDLFITGEIKHDVYWSAVESGLSVLAGGHYRSEVFGVSALKGYTNHLGIDTVFIEGDTGL